MIIYLLNKLPIINEILSKNYEIILKEAKYHFSVYTFRTLRSNL